MSDESKDLTLDDLNPGHYHEFMDRASMFTSMFNEHVLEHPAGDLHPRLREKAEQIANLMGDLYQMAGEVHDTIESLPIRFDQDENEEAVGKG